MADDKHEEHTLKRPIRSPFVWSPDEKASRVLARLIDLEPKLSKIVARDDAWAIVTETMKKIALWLSAIAGGFYVLREIIRGLAG